MNNARGFAALDQQVARLRELSELAKKSAPAAAEAVEAAFKAQIARGVDAEGKAWPKTQDGQQALRGAAKSLVVVHVGSTVFARLSKHVARHNNGTARGGIERAIFPKRGLPAHLAKAVRSEVSEQFAEIMK